MKKSVFVMLVAAALVSCSESKLFTPPAEVDGGEVSIAAKSVEKLVDTGVTRAPYDGDISSENPLEARVVATKAEGGTLHANGKMKFVGGSSVSLYDVNSLNSTDEAKFPGSATLYLAGLYPYDGWALDKAATTATIDVEGNNDIMSAGQQQTSSDAIVGGSAPTLTFNHLLTKLEVKAMAESNRAADYWGEVQRITLSKAKAAVPLYKATVTLSTGNVTFSDSEKRAVPFYGMDSDQYDEALMSAFNLGGTLTPVAYNMIAPIANTGTATDLELEIVTLNFTKTVHVQLPAFDSTAGRAFGIELTFREPDNIDDYIQASAKVIKWEFSGNVPVDVE